MEEVFLTTLNTDNYLTGVLVLARNIKEFCTHRLVVLVSDDLKDKTYDTLKLFQISYITMENSTVSEEVENVVENESLHGHWINTFFKLKIFDLIQFRKIVYIDSDMMVQKPLDELFQKENMSAVIAGKSFPGNESYEDINSGIFVFKPKEGLSKELINLIPVVAKKKKSFGDQDVLAEYFKDWKDKANLHLAEEYNVFWMYYDFYYKKSTIRVVHFIGKVKPWMMSRRRVLKEYFKCILKGNIYAIGALRKYRKYIKAVKL